MTRGTPCWLAAAAFGVALGACERKPDPTRQGAPGATASASASVTASAPRPSPPPPKPPPCRVIQLVGTARLADGSPLRQGQPIVGRDFVEVDEKSNLTTRDTRSAREVTVVGPARVLPCFSGEERYLLSRGVLETAPAAGARPGATVLVGTPLGIVDYGDAKARISVARGKVTVEVTAGEVTVTAVGAAKRTGPERLGAAQKKASLSGAADPAALLEACEKDAEEARRGASAVLGGKGGDAGPLGERAREQFRARQKARATCTAAGAAADTLEDQDERRRAWRKVHDAERRWRAVPSPRP